MSSDKSNQCSICLEQVLNGSSAGVLNPCGHCYHEDCFNGWRSHSISSSYRRECKCPLCNTKVASFVKFFLAAPDGANSDDDDDDCSLSSCSTVATTPNKEDDDKVDDDDKNHDDSEQEEAGDVPDAAADENDGSGNDLTENPTWVPPNNNNPNDNEANNIVNLVDDDSQEERNHNIGQGGIVDLTQSPQRTDQSSSQRSVDTGSANAKIAASQVSQDATIDENNKECPKRLKRIAKRYKRKSRQLASTQSEMQRQKSQLIEKHKLLTRDYAEIESELAQYEESTKHQGLELEGLKLKVVRLEGRNSSLAEQLRSTQTREENILSDMRAMKKKHENEKKKFSNKSMVETELMIKRTNEIEKENKELKQDLRLLEQRLQGEIPAFRSRSGQMDDEPLLSKKKKKQSMSKNAKSLRQMASADHPSFSDDRERASLLKQAPNTYRTKDEARHSSSTKQSHVEKPGIATPKYSQFAIRISAAAKKKISTKNASRSSDLLAAKQNATTNPFEDRRSGKENSVTAQMQRKRAAGIHPNVNHRAKDKSSKRSKGLSSRQSFLQFG